MVMDYSEILKNARDCSGPLLQRHVPCVTAWPAAPRSPAPAASGTAATMLRNYQKWQVCINMDTICETPPIGTTFTMFGRTFAAPIFCRPGGSHEAPLYGDKYDDLTYNDILVSSCAQAGIAASPATAPTPP